MKCGSSSAKIRCPPPQRPVVLKWTTAAQPRVHAGRPGTAFDFVSREEPLSSGCFSHHKRVAYRSVCGRPSLHDLFFFNFNHTICTRVVDPNPHEEERLEEEFNDPHEVCARSEPRNEAWPPLARLTIARGGGGGGGDSVEGCQHLDIKPQRHATCLRHKQGPNHTAVRPGLRRARTNRKAAHCSRRWRWDGGHSVPLPSTAFTRSSTAVPMPAMCSGLQPFLCAGSILAIVSAAQRHKHDYFAAGA